MYGVLKTTIASFIFLAVMLTFPILGWVSWQTFAFIFVSLFINNIRLAISLNIL